MANIRNEDYIINQIIEFVENDPSNTLPAQNNIRIYETPIIGFASANDPCFNELCKPGIVGPKFILPEEWLPNAKSVIVYFLPFTKEIRDSNRQCGLPSKEWISARIDGENSNNSLRAFLISLLKNLNSDAVSLVLIHALALNRLFQTGQNDMWPLLLDLELSDCIEPL